MGDTCSRPEKDNRHEVDKSGPIIGMNQPVQNKVYDSDARFYENEGFDYTKARQNKIYESKNLDKPLDNHLNERAVHENGRGGQQYEQKSLNFDKSDAKNAGIGDRNHDFYDLRASPNPINNSYSQNNAYKRTNFYEVEFDDAQVYNVKKGAPNQVLDDDITAKKDNRIFDDNSKVKRTKSPEKVEQGQKKVNDNLSKSSNIFFGNNSNSPFKQANDSDDDTDGKGSRLNKTNIPTNKTSTFKDFLQKEPQVDDATKSKLTKYRNQTPNKRTDRSLERSDSKSNVKVAVKSELEDIGYRNSQSNRLSQHKPSLGGQDYERYGYDSTNNNGYNGSKGYNDHFNNNGSEPKDNWGNLESRNSNSMKNSQNLLPNERSQKFGDTLSRTQPLNTESQQNGPMNEFMKMSVYKESHAFNGITESQFNRLPSVNDYRGIRESNVHNLPEFQPRNSEYKGLTRHLSPIKEESHVDYSDKFVPTRLKDGNTYFGDLKDNQPHGKGREFFTNGDVYTGEFCEGKRHGEGTYEKKDDYIFIGTSKGNKFEGKGKKLFANGDTFEGIFRNGKEEGTGMLKNGEGKLLKHGMWIDGEYTQL